MTDAAIGRVLWPIEAIGHTNASIFDVFHHQNSGKRMLVYAKAPVFNRGMTYQYDGKDLPKVSI